ncbi:nuclear transport factor 2 family protein [Nocardia pseudovaccinii]|uniref:nuclear transport factor 2 family protein n=1 Tax=Nocardia pseudovaccinii TaxID=189540 RepID=UPI003D92D9EA
METAVDPQTLQAINVIESLKARYFRTLDTKDWSAFGTALADDVDVDATALGGDRVRGASNHVAALQTDYGDRVTVHHGHMPEIEVHTPAAATGVWALQDLLIWPDNIRGGGFGHYHETYTLDGDRWRISSTTLTRLYLDPTAAQRLFRSSQRYRWSIGRWAASFRRRRP